MNVPPYQENALVQMDELVRIEKAAIAKIDGLDQGTRESGIPRIKNNWNDQKDIDNFERALLLGRRIGLMSALFEATRGLPGIRLQMFQETLGIKVPTFYPEVINEIINYTKHTFGLAFNELFRNARTTSLKAVCGSIPKLESFKNGKTVVLIDDLTKEKKPRVYFVDNVRGNYATIVTTWRPFQRRDRRTVENKDVISEINALKILKMSNRIYRNFLLHAMVGFSLGREMRSESLAVRAQPSDKNWLVG